MSVISFQLLPAFPPRHVPDTLSSMKDTLVGTLVPGILAAVGVFLLAWWIEVGPIRRSLAVPAWVDIGPTGQLNARESGQDDAPPFDPLKGLARFREVCTPPPPFGSRSRDGGGFLRSRRLV